MENSSSLFVKGTASTVKRSLILAGGGIRLAYQAGVLKALEEHGIEFNHVDGTSGGIFNTAMLASGLAASEMMRRWRELRILHFVSLRPLRNYLNPVNMMAFADADGIREHIFPSLGIDLEKINANQDVDATFNVCNFSKKTIEAISHSDVTEDLLIAGVSLPIFMPAIKVDQCWYSDAVWIKDANLMHAVRQGAEEIWLVWGLGNTDEYLTGAFNQYVHMIEMSANGGVLEELAQIKEINQRIERGDSPYGQKQPIKLHIIKPRYPLPLDPDLFFNRIDTRTLINLGYENAKTYLNDTDNCTSAHDYGAIKMSNPGVLLNYRQVYTGNTEIDGQSSKIKLYLDLSFHLVENELEIDQLSSIRLPNIAEELSGYPNKASLQTFEGKRTLVIQSEFRYSDQQFHISGEIPLLQEKDFLWGLAFKTVDLTISNVVNETRHTLYKVRLKQPIKGRIPWLRKMSMRYLTNGKERRRKKREIIDRIYS